LVSNPQKITVPGFGAFLRRGWVVAATDYQGLGTAGPNAYLDGVSEGRAVLDSARAAQHLPAAAAGKKTLVWGHSQGGQASLFAGSIAASYAPNLELLGVAAAAPAVELAQLLDLDGSDPIGLVLGSYMLWSWSRTYPGLSLKGAVAPSAVKLIDAVATRCLRGEKALIEELVLAKLEKLGNRVSLKKVIAIPAWARVLKANTAAASGSGPPLLIAQGTADTIIRPQTTYNYILRLCAAGRPVNELRMEGVNHPNAGVAAAPAVVSWAMKRLAGVPVTSDCVSTQSGAG